MLEIDNNLQYLKCPVCNASIIHPLGAIEYDRPLKYSTTEISITRTPELWACKVCRSSFVQNAVPEDKSILLYSQGDAAERWSHTSIFEQAKTQIAVKTLSELLDVGKKVLDIGCNAGEFLDFAKERGCKTFGVEYSSHSLGLLKEKGHTATSNIKNLEVNFDLITAFDLVEHLYNVPSFLDICSEKLIPNGYLVILTGNISCLSARLTGENWWYVRYPEHIVFPSKRFFQRHLKYKLVNWIPTYAAPGYERSSRYVLKEYGREIIKGTYSGNPSLGPDHALILLQRKSFK